jgi:PAS domain S-box-containing protein
MARAKTKQQLTIENEELRVRLQELEETLEAIRSGAVDAIVASGPAGDRVYTLEGADHAYHTMVESMNEGAVTVLTDGTILYANRQFGQMTGASPSDIVGRPFHDFVQASDRPIWDGFIRQAGSDGLKAEIRFGNRSASEIPVQISATPIDLGGSKALALVVTDLTESRRYEEIVTAERLSRYILEQSLEGVAVCINGRILFASRRLHEIYGGNPLMQPFDRLFPLRMSEREVFSVEIPQSGQVVKSAEVSYRNPDGNSYSLILNAGPLYGDEHRILGCLISLTDITERKLAEDALRASEEKYRNLFENMAEEVHFWRVVRDEAGRIKTWLLVDANPPTLKTWGRQRVDEIKGKTTDEIFGPGAAEHYMPVVQKIMTEGIPYSFEDYFPHLDKYFRFTSVPLGDHFITTGADITGIKKAEKALQESEARFRLLSATAGRLLVSEDPQVLINDLCRDVMEHLDCQAFFNFMVDERAGRLRLNACAGIPEEEVRKLEWLDYGVAVCGCVARDNTRIIAEDIFHTPDVRTELVRSYGIQAYCCHPLKAQERLIGTLSFGTKTRARFAPEEVELMRTVADQVAVALQRVQAQKELRASEEALRLANEHLEQRVRERTMDLQNLTVQLERNRGELRKLASELVITEERERKRIAGVLHDEIAQTLAAARMRIDLLHDIPPGSKDRRTLEEAKALLVQSIQETRALMTDIGNPLLFDMGLKAACESLADRLTKKHRLRINCDMQDAYKHLNPDVKSILYQLVRELLNNVVKHSQARNAHIAIDMGNGYLRVKVTDDGVGFDPRTLGVPTSEGGYGLYSIRERLIAIDGSLSIESAPGAGTVVTAIVPAIIGLITSTPKLGGIPAQ